MPAYLSNSKRTLAFFCLAAGIALTAGTVNELAAEEPSVDRIIEALTPKGLQRSLTLPPAGSARDDEEDKFIDSLRNRPARSLTLKERGKIVDYVNKDKKPTLDIDINFEYNSAELTPQGKDRARDIGKALTSPGLQGGTFVVEGHTDAKGSKKFNLKLSERRADAVKRFLVEEYRIPAANLVPSGYGETLLKNKDNPDAGENRRVRVDNWTNNVAHK
ncbi:MAG: OmpA family protein [Beijerinckiaceae bacterium]|nr:OmpA family protein [Beijerinckiaceae bacterium]